MEASFSRRKLVTPEELKAFVVSEIRKWAEIVKAAGIRPE